MTIQMIIIGLGQIGTSIGMALAEKEDMFDRVGHDKDPLIARKAVKMQAVDRFAINLPSAVRKADVVILALPMDQIRETLNIIAPELREDAVVMDTAPVKEVVSAWAGELLPPKRHYVGLTPVLNPNYLLEQDYGIDAARADLFRDGLVAIVAPPRTASEAIKLAADLTRLLGASPMFADPVEMDSLMAATHILPQLISAALLNATVDQPGWREGRKVAGRAYAEVTSPSTFISQPKTLRTSAILNRENVLRVMDGLIASLNALRTDIEGEDQEALDERLERARQGRDLWWRQRLAADWVEDAYPSPDVSTGSEMFGRLLGLKRRPKDKK